MAYESKIRIFGMPLLSVGFVAKGFISIGFSGIGVITIAQFGVGIISITQFGVGLISIAQFSAGGFTVGQFAFGLLFAFGMFAIGFASIDCGTAWGYYFAEGPCDPPIQLAALISQIENHSEPLFIWVCFLLILGLYLLGQREKIRIKMTISDLFKKKIYHSNFNVRLKGVTKTNNQDILYQIAHTDTNSKVRYAAVKKLLDKNTIEKIAFEADDPNVRIAAVEKIDVQEILERIVKTDPSVKVRLSAVKKINNLIIIKRIILSEKNRKIASYLIYRIDEKNLLNEISENADESFVRKLAKNKLALGKLDI
jgi:hypothetical protein